MRTPRTAVAVAVAAVAAALAFTGPAHAAEATPSSPSSVSSVLDEPADLRVRIAQLMSLPEAGSEVEAKGRQALNGTVDDMRAFLETGYRLAQAQDDRVALARLISRPETAPAVRTAAIAILRVSDPDEMRWFLEAGQYRI